MIHHLYGAKIVPVVAVVIFLAMGVIAESSVFLPWLLGAFVTIGCGLIALGWKIQGRLSVLETQVIPLWSSAKEGVSRTLQAIVPLEKPQEIDRLLEQLENLTITCAGRAILKELLKEILVDPTQNKHEKNRAKLLLSLMDDPSLKDLPAKKDVKAGKSFFGRTLG
jgi:hypothetical protein